MGAYFSSIRLRTLLLYITLLNLITNSTTSDACVLKCMCGLIVMVQYVISFVIA